MEHIKGLLKAVPRFQSSTYISNFYCFVTAFEFEEIEEFKPQLSNLLYIDIVEFMDQLMPQI